MMEEALFLIDEGIPFSMEKPCGMNAFEVEKAAALAESKGVFAEVPFVFRDSEFVKQVKRAGDVEYLSFRFIGGPPSRYIESGCDWMLDPRQSGGGPTRNIGIHFFDLFRYLSAKDDDTVVSSVMENRTWGLDIEDYAAIVLRNSSTTCLIETGYGYPAPHGLQDLRFSARAREAYVTATTRDTYEYVLRNGDKREIVTDVPLTNFYGSALCYDYMADVITRVQRDEPPQGTLGDMAAISRLVDAAYRQAGWPVWGSMQQ
jgi:predicted dehydrogenase